jgi:hypothetical protein
VASSRSFPLTPYHSSTSQFLSNDASDYRFERLVLLLVSHIRAQRLVDELLVVATSRSVDLVTEPTQDFIV